jgi:hypothetical protein
MKYCIWSKNDIAGLDRRSPVKEVVTEINSAGAVLREIGLAEDGSVVYAQDDGRGLFDGAKVEVESSKNEMSLFDFQALWRRAKVSLRTKP